MNKRLRNGELELFSEDMDADIVYFCQCVFISFYLLGKKKQSREGVPSGANEKDFL
jgi:hypothetical protein